MICQVTLVGGPRPSEPASSESENNKDNQASEMKVPALSLSQAQQKTSLFFALCSKVCLWNCAYWQCLKLLTASLFEEQLTVPFVLSLLCVAETKSSPICIWHIWEGSKGCQAGILPLLAMFFFKTVFGKFK